MARYGYYILIICSCFLALVHGLPIFENHKNVHQEVIQVPRVKTEVSLNKVLSMDSDEDLFFDQFWLEEYDDDDDDDDGDAYDFVYNFFDASGNKNIKSSVMLVSSSSDEHVIELALMAKAKDTLMFVGSIDQDDDQDDFDMNSET